MSRHILRFLSRKGPNKSLIHNYQCVRKLLSASYKCDVEWKNRLEEEILKSTNAVSLAGSIQEKYDRRAEASPLDMDIFANVVHKLDDYQLDFAQSLLQQFRSSVAGRRQLPSTAHALLRTLHERNEDERLLNILTDKVKFGIYMDNHIANMLLDDYTEAQDFEKAATIVADLMLQEELHSSPLTTQLAWRACDMFVWNTPALVPFEPPPQPEEEIWRRLTFMPNHWYDDHWDIPTLHQKVGKALVCITKDFESSLGSSYRLLGYGLWQKYDDGIRLLSEAAEKEQKISRIAIDRFKELLDEQLVESERPEKEKGYQVLEDVFPYYTEEQKQELQQKLSGAIKEAESAGAVIDMDIRETLLEQVRSLVARSSQSAEASLREDILHWTELRAEYIRREERAIDLVSQRAEIRHELEELQAKQERLSYFEQWEQINLGISRKVEEEKEEEVQAEEVFVPPPAERGRGFKG